MAHYPRISPRPRRSLSCVIAASLVLTVGCGDGGAQDPNSDPGPGPGPGGGPPPNATEFGAVQLASFTPLPPGRQLGLEDYFATHWLHASPGSEAAQQMYTGACRVDQPNPTVFVSVSTGDHTDCWAGDELDRFGRGGCGGALIELTYDPATGYSQVGPARDLPECIELYGVAPKQDCSTVAVLCRRENMATENASDEITKNSLLTHPSSDWMTHPVGMGTGRRMDEIWLYEWPDGDIAEDPNKYVVHRAIGTSYGLYSLIRGNDDTYGIGVRSDLFSDDGRMHSADAMLVLDANTFDYTNRGYDWACGVGHTVTNFMTFNPTTSKYAMHCKTDYNPDEQRAGDAYLRLEDGGKDHDGDGNNEGYFRHYNWDDEALGAATSVVPVSDGGFITTLVGRPEDTARVDRAFKVNPEPTSVGVARFNAAGELVGEVRWLERDDDGLLSNPVIGELGNDRFVFGWATMHRFSSYETDGGVAADFKIGHQFHLYEIDADLNQTSQQLDLPPEMGWGEWARFTSAGPGRVAWASGSPVTYSLESAAEEARYVLDRDVVNVYMYTTAAP